MDMLSGAEIAAARLAEWRKLAQGLHARYLTEDFSAGARFVAALAEAGNDVGHHPTVAIGAGYVDLKLVSPDAIYRDGDTEHVVEWVTQQDVDLARRITAIAAEQNLDADPASVSVIELGLDARDSRRSLRCGRRSLRACPRPRGTDRPATRSVTPQDECPICGSETQTRRSPPGSASISRSMWRRR